MTDTKNQDKKSPEALSTRYATRGYQIGAVVGILGALAYSISPANPNRGHWLSLNTVPVIFGAIIVSNLVGAALGYGIGKLLEARQTSKL